MWKQFTWITLFYPVTTVGEHLGKFIKIVSCIFQLLTYRSRNALQCHQCHRSVPHLSTAAYVIKPETSGTGHLCEICNKEFKTKQSLKVHTQAIHEGIKYNCEFCPHSATTQSNLKVHVQKKHSSMQALAPMQPYM